jgi:hypothetical protein
VNRCRCDGLNRFWTERGGRCLGRGLLIRRRVLGRLLGFADGLSPSQRVETWIPFEPARLVSEHEPRRAADVVDGSPEMLVGPVAQILGFAERVLLRSAQGADELLAQLPCSRTVSAESARSRTPRLGP